MYTFVTGGYRSGRTDYALRRASDLGAPPWAYLSAGAKEQEQVRKRLARNQADEEAIWQVETFPEDLTSKLTPEWLGSYGAIVLDGFAKWLDQRIAADVTISDKQILADVEEISDRLYRSSTPVVIVTREVGLGPMPDAEQERRILRITTSANQILAGNATNVVLMVSGVAMRVH